MKNLLLFVLFLIFSSILFSQESTDSITVMSKSSSFAKAGESVFNALSYENKHYSLAFFPALGYSPRTGVELGFLTVIKLRENELKETDYNRPSILRPTFLVSTKRMVEFLTDYDLYFKHGYQVNGRIHTRTLPDEYFGVGNEEKLIETPKYITRMILLEGFVYKSITKFLFGGFLYDFNFTSNVDWDFGFGNDSIPADGWTNSLGPAIKFDNRDDSSYPYKGMLLQSSWSLGGDYVGGGYDFNSFKTDLRIYQKLGSGNKNPHIIASQLIYQTINGDVPFYKLAFLGGNKIVRGIPHQLKYVDKNLWLAQLEYRKMVWWRFGCAIFGGAGNVYSDSYDTFSNTHYFYGGGLRVKVLEDERVNFRVDFGKTNRGDSGFFITIGEAF